MGVRQQLTELRNRPEGQSFEVWEEANGFVAIEQNGNPVSSTVVSTDPPNNNDGRPDGTIYIQVA